MKKPENMPSGIPASPPRQSIDLFRLLVEAVQDQALVLLDPAGHIASWNPGAELLTGYKAQEMIGQPISCLHTPADVACGRPQGNLQIALAEDRYEEEGQRVRKDGSLFWASITLTVLRDPVGAHVGFAEVIRDMTGRRRLQSEVALREQQLDSFFSGATAGLALLDKNLRFLQINNTLAEMNGVPTLEHLGRTIREVVPKLAPVVGPILQQVLATGEPVLNIEVTGQTQRLPGVQRHWVESFFPVVGVDGTPEGVGAIVVEITERKKTEAALRESEMRQRLIIENTGMVTWDVDLTSGGIICSEAAFRLLGYEPAPDGRATYEMWLACIHPDDQSRVMEAVERARRERSLYAPDYRIVRVNTGEVRWLSAFGRFLYDQAGGATRFIGVLFDNTEHKRAEEEWLRSEEKFRRIIESTPTAMHFYRLEQDGRLVLRGANPAADRLLGISHRDLLGQTMEKAFPRLTATDIPRLYRKVALGEMDAQAFEIPYQDERFTGTYDVQVFRTEPCSIAVCFVDISERKRADAEREKLEAQFFQAQKMESVGRLAGGVAHDFNNLLTIILGDSEMILMGLAPDDPNRTLVIDILEAGERAASLTRQLLAFSRRQILELKVLHLNEVVRNVEKMLHRLIGEDIRLTTILSPSVDRVRVDHNKMEQVLVNLAVNARDAMPQGGRLTIETSASEMDEDFCRCHPGCIPGRYTLLSLSDSGCGMTPEIKQRIFEPFFTTKEAGKGTGLGLATAFGIVKQSGGYIDVDSEVGLGTCFKIYLPAIDGEAAAEPTGKKRGTAPQGNETILLAEDDENVRRIAKLALETQGYNVLEASNGQGALTAAERANGPIQLLVTDVVMPEMNGRQLAEILQARNPGLKVLFISGYINDLVIQNGITEVHAAYLQKPFSPMALARKVREVLGG